MEIEKLKQLLKLFWTKETCYPSLRKKYNIYDLYVVTINRHKYICERINSLEYMAVVIGRKIFLRNNKYKVEKLTDYSKLLEKNNYQIKKDLVLSKEEVLKIYININVSDTLDMDHNKKLDIIYKSIGEFLTPESRENIKSLLKRSCDTCASSWCRIEQVDKPIYDCDGWENDKIVGEYYILQLNKKQK